MVAKTKAKPITKQGLYQPKNKRPAAKAQARNKRGQFVKAAAVKPASANRNSRRGGKRSIAVQLPLQEIDRGLLQGISRFWPWTRQTQLLALRRLVLFNPILRSYMQLAKNGVIGSRAITPTFTTVTDKKARRALEECWAMFERGVTVGGDLTMRQYQRGLVQQYLTDGRVFGILKFGNHLPCGIAVQPVPRESLAEGTGEEKDSNGRRIRFGVIYNKQGQMVAYRFWETNEGMLFATQGGGFTPWAQTGGKTTEVPKDKVLDLRNAERLDEWDAAPSFLLSALEGITGVNELDLATLKTMKAAACKMGFYEKELGAIESDEGIAGGAGSGEEFEQQDPIEDLPENMAHGSIDGLPPGWRFNSFDPSWPNVDGVQYRLQLLRPVIAALGADYNSVCADGVGVNYNSLRHMTLQSRDTWRFLQDDIRESVVKPLYLAWLESVQMKGLVSLPKKAAAEAMMTSFSTRAYPWVDPVKDVAAKKEQMLLGTISPQDVASESGRNLRDVYADLAQAADLIDEIGKDKIEMILQLIQGKPAAPEQEQMPGGMDDGGAGDDKKKGDA